MTAGTKSGGGKEASCKMALGGGIIYQLSKIIYQLSKNGDFIPGGR